jgi:histidine phosphotransferase ChpT
LAPVAVYQEWLADNRGSMTTTDQLGELELAALLCSRVCHDVISPVGAITNGLEVLDDETDEETRGFAMDLIRKSAARASASLLFARLAYGAAGSAGAELSLGELREVAAGFVDSDKLRLVWESPDGALAKDVGRLLLNFMVIAQHAIPRGGTIAVRIAEPLGAPMMTVRCVGAGARIPEGAARLIAGEVPGSEVDARSVQPYFTGLLARRVGAEISLVSEDDGVLIEARVTN